MQCDFHSFLKHFCLAVWVCLPNLSIRELSNTYTIWVQNVFLSIGELNSFDARLFNLLNGAVGEDTLLLSVLKDALDCAIGETIIATIRD